MTTLSVKPRSLEIAITRTVAKIAPPVLVWWCVSDTKRIFALICVSKFILNFYIPKRENSKKPSQWRCMLASSNSITSCCIKVYLMFNLSLHSDLTFIKILNYSVTTQSSKYLHLQINLTSLKQNEYLNKIHDRRRTFYYWSFQGYIHWCSATHHWSIDSYWSWYSSNSLIIHLTAGHVTKIRIRKGLPISKNKFKWKLTTPTTSTHYTARCADCGLGRCSLRHIRSCVTATEALRGKINNYRKVVTMHKGHAMEN
jgi:hypothetical protein